MADFTWSFSSLKEYINCPKKYQEVRILQNYSFIDTPQTIYGKEVHEALELYVRDDKPLAKIYLRFKKMVDTLIAIPGVKYPEYKMALTRKMEQCDFNDENRWVRGIKTSGYLTLHHYVDGVRLKRASTISPEDKKEKY